MYERECWRPEDWRAYCESPNPYRQYKQERDRSLTLGLLEPRDGERILEVGCGYGRISRNVAIQSRIRLVGIDQSEAMIQTWKGDLGGGMGCRGDALQLPFRNESFDAVVCTGVLMHLADQRQALEELCRVLRPGGRLVISGNNLLSPFALPAFCWMRLKARVRQAYKLPGFYRRTLRKLGLEVRLMAGDTLLAVGFVPLAPVVPSRIWLPLIRRLDRRIERPPLCYFAYEAWFLGVKMPCA